MHHPLNSEFSVLKWQSIASQVRAENSTQSNDAFDPKTTAAQNEDVLSYYKVRGLYFLAVVFVDTIDL